MSNKKEDLFGLNNDSEEEDISFDGEEQEDSRFSKTRLQKQSFSDDESAASDDSDDSDSEEEKDDSEKEDNEAEEEEEETETKLGGPSEDEDNESEAEGYNAPEDLAAFGATNKKRVRTSKRIKSLTPEELEKFEKARKKTGVCYLSRIPLFMKPSRVRSLLEKHAEIGRIYLVPEDTKVTARRKKYTKNRRTNFVEGWVEFKDKKIAKALAEHLNMKEIGGKRKSQNYHEIWNIKYLPKFKWHHLTEHMAHEKQARQQRLRNEIAQSNRENKTYIQNVERAKMLQNMEQKKRKREGESAASSEPSNQKIQRTFVQRGKVDREVDPLKSGKQSMEKIDTNLKGVLGSIFSKK